MPLDEKDIIKRISSGEQLAMRELMAEYKFKLYNFIKKYIKDEEESYDILQDTFCKVYFKASTYNPEYTLKSWIFQIALNNCRDYLRKNKQSKHISINDEGNNLINQLTSEYTDESEQILAKEKMQFLELEIQNLPVKLKEALLLYSQNEMTLSECAKTLEISAKNFETRFYRAKNILLQKLKSKY